MEVCDLLHNCKIGHKLTTLYWDVAQKRKVIRARIYTSTWLKTTGNDFDQLFLSKGIYKTNIVEKVIYKVDTINFFADEYLRNSKRYFVITIDNLFDLLPIINTYDNIS